MKKQKWLADIFERVKFHKTSQAIKRNYTWNLKLRLQLTKGNRITIYTGTLQITEPCAVRQ